MIALAIACVCLFIALVYSIVFNVRHARIILNVEDALSDSLDVCDDAYATMTHVLGLPVAVDSPEVRYVTQKIQNVRDSILYVSNVLASPMDGVARDEDIGDDDEN